MDRRTDSNSYDPSGHGRGSNNKDNFPIEYFDYSIHNQFHIILRLLDVSPNFPFNLSETMHDYCL